MPLTVHHMSVSQSERIVWLCEELGIPYDLKVHKRDPIFSPESLKSVPGNKIGTAPVIQDDGTTLAESGAIVEWIIQKHGNGRLAPKPSDVNYAEYLKWFHSANATLQPALIRLMTIKSGVNNPDDPIMARAWDRFWLILQGMDDRLSSAKYLAGEELTAADIMTVFSLSTMRQFIPFGLHKYPNIVRYLKDISERDAYRRAMQKGEDELVMTADAPQMTYFDKLKAKKQQQQGQSKLS